MSPEKVPEASLVTTSVDATEGLNVDTAAVESVTLSKSSEVFIPESVDVPGMTVENTSKVTLPLVPEVSSTAVVTPDIDELDDESGVVSPEDTCLVDLSLDADDENSAVCDDVSIDSNPVDSDNVVTDDSEDSSATDEIDVDDMEFEVLGTEDTVSVGDSERGSELADSAFKV